MKGQQLHCFKFASVGSSNTVADAAAPVSSLSGASADGGVPAASAMLQSHAAKEDLGDAADTGVGKPLHPPVWSCRCRWPQHCMTLSVMFSGFPAC